MVQNTFLIAFCFFLEIVMPVVAILIFTPHYLMFSKHRCCYFKRDSAEVTTGFLDVTPVPHLNRPLSRVKTGRQFICGWRDWETKKGTKRKREKQLDGPSGNLRPVFVWFQTTPATTTPSQEFLMQKYFTSRFWMSSPFSSKQDVWIFKPVYGISFEHNCRYGHFRAFTPGTGHLH